MPDRTRLKSTARVFFALWPDAACRALCHDESRRLHALAGGRRTRSETLHLTLVFLGDIDRARIPGLIDAAHAVSGRSFMLNLDRADCWRHNGIAFLAPSAVPGALSELVSGLEDALAKAGIRYDRRPYKAHMTLLRKADCARMREEMLATPVIWTAREFVLVESLLGPAGASYVPLARFELLQDHDRAEMSAEILDR